MTMHYEAHERPGEDAVRPLLEHLRSCGNDVAVEAVRAWTQEMLREALGDELGISQVTAWTPDGESNLVMLLSDTIDGMVFAFVDAMLDRMTPEALDEMREHVAREFLLRLKMAAAVCNILDDMDLPDISPPPPGDTMDLAAFEAMVAEWERDNE